MLISALIIISSVTNAAEFTVKLLTTGSDGGTMVMEPGFIKIAPGDTINFVPSDTSHNAQSFAIPAGAKEFNTPFGKPTKVTFDTEGVYLYKCMPHIALGMVGVVQVGAPTNLTEAKAAWDKTKAGVAMNKERMDSYLAKVK